MKHRLQKKHFFIVWLFLSSIISYQATAAAAKPASQPTAQNLNLVISLEAEDWNWAVGLDFSHAIDAGSSFPTVGEYPGIAIISSTPALHCFVTQKSGSIDHTGQRKFEDQIDKIHSSWDVYMDETENFAILIPKSWNPHEDGLNFNKKIFGQKPVSIDLFADEKFRSRQLSLQAFRDLFDLTTAQSNKFIYLVGHGMEKTRIAGLSPEDYMKVLDLFNSINTKFLFVSSCYSGGSNISLIQNMALRAIDRLEHADTKEAFTLSQLSYPLAIGATTDEATFGGIRNIKDFFANLNKQKNYSSISKGIKDALVALYNGNKNLMRLPSVRFPSANSFFRAIDVDEMVILTYHEVKRQILLSSLVTIKKFRDMAELEIRKKEDAKQRLLKIPPQNRPQSWGKTVSKLDSDIDKLTSEAKSQQEPTVRVGRDSRCVLVYPVNLSKLTIDTTKCFSCPFVSKIPGPAMHFIGKMYSPNTNIFQSVNDFFLPILRETHISGEESFVGTAYGVSPKAWFIQEHVSGEYNVYPKLGISDDDNRTFHGAIIYKHFYRQDPTIPMVTVLCCGPETTVQAAAAAADAIAPVAHYKLTKMLPLSSSPENIDRSIQRIDQQTYVQLATKIRDEIIGANQRSEREKAISEATGGNESTKTVDTMFDEFLQKMRLEKSMDAETNVDWIGDEQVVDEAIEKIGEYESENSIKQTLPGLLWILAQQVHGRKSIESSLRLLQSIVNNAHLFVVNLTITPLKELCGALISQGRQAELMSIIDSAPKTVGTEQLSLTLLKSIVYDERWQPETGIPNIAGTSAKDILKKLDEFSYLSTQDNEFAKFQKKLQDYL